MSKSELTILSSIGFCKNCFNLKRDGSAYCGNCQSERMKIYIDDIYNFPLLDKAKKIFPITLNTVFTYGDTIYANIENLDDGLMAHEITHVFQQIKMGKDIWWKKYFKDKGFRLEQEEESYRIQYKVYKRNNTIKAEIRLNKIARDLSSELYGGIISFKEAVEVIKN